MVIKEHMSQNPSIFGPNGGYSRAYAMGDTAAAIAMMVGPIVSGWLRQTVGYFYMNVIFGTCRPIQFLLANIYVINQAVQRLSFSCCPSRHSSL